MGDRQVLRFLTKKEGRKQTSFHMFYSCIPSASGGFDDEYCKCVGVGDGDLNIAYPTNGTQFINIRWLLAYFKGFQPEWYISTLYHCRDIPFWSETLYLLSPLFIPFDKLCTYMS